MLLKILINIILIPANIILLVIRIPLKVTIMPNLKLWTVYGKNKNVATAKVKFG